MISIIIPQFTPPTPPPLQPPRPSLPSSAAGPTRCAQAAARAVGGRAKRVLVVDDDASTVNALKSLLRTSGYEVITASTVAGALAMIDASVDGIILDLMLPDGDGAEVLRGVRVAGLNARVCVTTGVSSPAWLNRVTALGADCILRKPIDLSELLQKL